MNIFTKTIWQKKREGPGAIYLLLLCMIWLSACKSIANTAGRIISDPEMVIFYPTYGYLEEDEWVILMRTYVFEYRNVLEEVAESIGTVGRELDRKSTRLNSSHVAISYAVFCLKNKNRSLVTRITY